MYPYYSQAWNPYGVADYDYEYDYYYGRQLPSPPPPPPGGFPGGGGQGQPPGPPPGFTPPEQQAAVFAVDPGGIRRCLYRNTYVWLNNGQQFWFYPTFVGRNSVAGFRWFPGFRQWGYFGIDLRQIRSFTCF
ncbi:hypothetical protein GKZ89_06815 [Bacillus mangrovi]|uniref:Transporter n=1 Tax=Metabacillus mangrovi TaxID=1491830 RepID=A0A7X2S420_9BACI|nr:hypothetical protein [Metabacillus mangrovi]MTH53120.1 hypothetical protein [Metabacillus mangrovi]